MNRMRTFMFLLVAMLIASGALAFDDQRRGFALGLGLGIGSAKQSIEGRGGDLSIEGSTSTGGLATDVRIGGGFNEHWLLYWTSQQVFFSQSRAGDDVLFAQGLAGVGATYYLQPRAPSFFCEVALGVGALIDFDADASDSAGGLLLGFGYEFATHWQLGASWSVATLDQDEIAGVDIEAKITTFRLGVTWLAY